MSLPLKRTLGDIRSDIQTRLGFGMAGQAGVVNSALIDSMIRSAQEELYEEFDWLEMKAVAERLTGADQQYYDYPDDCNLDRPTKFAVLWGGKYQELTEGISLSDRSWSPGGVPQKYERREQYELWPVPATNEYTIRIEYIKVLAPLVADSDRTSINSHAVFVLALAKAKRHYRMPDADKYEDDYNKLVFKLKGRHRGKTKWGKSTPRSPYQDPPTSDQQV